MWWLGKVVGGGVGFLVGGAWGSVLGAVLGHGVDAGVTRLGRFRPLGAAEQGRLWETFCRTLFGVLGHLAKADGRVSEDEILFAESVMARMGLERSRRKAAIRYFTTGKAPDFPLAAALDAFRRASAEQPQLRRLFLETLISMTYQDGSPHLQQRMLLEQCRVTLRFSPAGFQRLERLVQFQRRAQVGVGAGRPGAPGRGAAVDPLAAAYRVLGIASRATDAEVTRAYRKLINRHHPDKLASRGLPDETIRSAGQKTHEVLRAYETVTRARKSA